MPVVTFDVHKQPIHCRVLFSSAASNSSFFIIGLSETCGGESASAQGLRPAIEMIRSKHAGAKDFSRSTNHLKIGASQICFVQVASGEVAILQVCSSLREEKSQPIMLIHMSTHNAVRRI